MSYTGIMSKVRQVILERPSLQRLFAYSLIPVEYITKVPIFDCRMCGQCVLHSTGLVCPMTCPKNLRNGPCGGVRMDGSCEVYPEKQCVWVNAVANSQRLPWPDEIHDLRPPVDWSLKGTSSWVNSLIGRDRLHSGCASEPNSALDVVNRRES